MRMGVVIAFVIERKTKNIFLYGPWKRFTQMKLLHHFFL